MTEATAGRAPGRPKPARIPPGGSDDVPVGRGAPCHVDVVVHTHWDREWYLPRETTLARLQAVTAEVLDQLDSGALPSFLFDGQTVALRDLLTVATPDMAARLRQHAQAGRLVLGPWYVSADEFLVSGESLLRNLEFGHADAAEVGQVQKLGYLPDTFGHVAQMPQVLAQFGISTAVLWRGADAEHDCFDWHAPDGTVAGTVFLTQGYYLTPLHGADWANALPPLLHRIAARRAPGRGAPLLLPHGGDHLAPQPSLAARVAQFNADQSDFELRLGTLAKHVDAALATPGPRQALQGELRHNTQAFVLPDVLSTRRPLKRAHQQLEDRLLGETEPLWAQLSTGAPPPALQAAWRLLIEQQAHDSICGCSIDKVHAEMAQRFVQLGQQLDALRQAALARAGMLSLHRLGAAGPDVFADDSACTLFNPLPQARSGWWVVAVFLHGVQRSALKLTTVNGTELTNQVLGIETAAELVSPLDDFPERLSGHRYELAVQATLPGLGALALRIDGVQADADSAWTDCAALENAAWRVEQADDGSLQLTDRRGGRVIDHALELLSERDVGDSYNFSPPAEPAATRAGRWWLQSARRSAHAQEMHLRIAMHLPASAQPLRPGRSRPTVLCHGELRLRLLGDEPALHARLVWHNAAQDQRTRLVLPWCDDHATSTFSDTAFALTERPVRLAQIPAEASRQEMPVVVQPSLSTVVAGPLAVLHRALHEHEVMQLDGVQKLALTLVRSVGWLSRRDLRTRGVGAGPDLATPGAQCLGEQVAEFQLLALQSTEPAHTALPAAQQMRRPPLLLRGHSAHWAGAVDIGNPVLMTSSVRRLEDGALELRLWNPTAQQQPLALDPGQWDLVYADGRPHPGPVDRLAPFAIHTLRQCARDGQSS
jgi:mannosylglycerate hydrolase